MITILKSFIIRDDFVYENIFPKFWKTFLTKEDSEIVLNKVRKIFGIKIIEQKVEEEELSGDDVNESEDSEI